jgi:hypothetical protein
MGSQVRVLWRPPAYARCEARVKAVAPELRLLNAGGLVRTRLPRGEARAPLPVSAVSGAMSIQKESDGFPEMNPRRRTTKVNFSIIVAVLVFFAVTIGVAVWVAKDSDSPDGTPAGPTVNR